MRKHCFKLIVIIIELKSDFEVISPTVFWSPLATEKKYENMAPNLLCFSSNSKPTVSRDPYSLIKCITNIVNPTFSLKTAKEARFWRRSHLFLKFNICSLGGTSKLVPLNVCLSQSQKIHYHYLSCF